MRRAGSWLVSWAIVGCVAAGLAAELLAEESAGEKTPDASPAAATAATESASPATHQVSVEPLRVELKIDGVFEATKMVDVLLKPKVASALVVQKAAAHGQQVKKGDLLLSLETDKIDEQIVAAEHDQKVSQATLRDAESDLKTLEANTAIDLQAAERAQQQAREELEYFIKVREPRSRESAEQSLKNARFQLEYAEEELKQLQQMYEADDLTEETEEIILRRAQRSVDSARFSLRSAEIAHERTLQRDLALDLLRLKEAAERQDNALSRARISIPTVLEKKRLDVAKLRRDKKQADDKLADLRRDRAALTVTAPVDGTVYYGPCTRGRWQDATKLAERLQPGISLTPNQTILTVVAMQPLQVRLDIAEKDIAHLKTGLTAQVVPSGRPELRLAARVASVSPIPISPGVFDCQLRLQNPPADLPVVPGMTCSVMLLAYDKPKALVVPLSAVFTEADGIDYVYVAVDEGQSEKRPVKLGKRTSDKGEVLEGLKAGEKILLQKPAGTKP